MSHYFVLGMKLLQSKYNSFSISSLEAQIQNLQSVDYMKDWSFFGT